MLDQREPSVVVQVGDVGRPAGGEVVDDGDPVAAGEEGVGHVRADEPAAAREQVVRHVSDRCRGG
ncbi:MAG: hypothetical protein V9G12_26115 [Microthrixaceae bacterium]